MSSEELAGHVCQALAEAGIVVTLTGGTCVTIWSQGRYVSGDLDFVEEGPVPRRQVRAVMKRLGFREKDRYFTHPDTTLFVEFPAGPLMVGDERVAAPAERDTPAGRLRLLSPTDCVKDRLAAFFHWNDRQSLEQAVMVARAQPIDLADVQRWSRAEGMEERFRAFERQL